MICPARIFVSFMLIISASAAMAQTPAFKRLKGADIAKTLSGKEFTDEVHWAERYKANGMIEGASMGRKTEKRWAVRANDLCITDQKGATCYEVWKSGTALEMRQPGGDSFPRTGILRR